MQKLKCRKPECEYEWEYNGKAKFFACCPRCHNQVSLRAPTRRHIVIVRDAPLPNTDVVVVIPKIGQKEK